MSTTLEEMCWRCSFTECTVDHVFFLVKLLQCAVSISCRNKPADHSRHSMMFGTPDVSGIYSGLIGGRRDPSKLASETPMLMVPAGCAISGSSSSGNPTGHFPCQYCGRVLHSRTGKQQHERLHEGRGFSCRHCDKSFTTNAALVRHVNGVHERQRYPCYRCNRTFCQLGHLRSHQKKSCTGILSASQQNPQLSHDSLQRSQDSRPQFVQPDSLPDSKDRVGDRDQDGNRNHWWWALTIRWSPCLGLYFVCNWSHDLTCQLYAILRQMFEINARFKPEDTACFSPMHENFCKHK